MLCTEKNIDFSNILSLNYLDYSNNCVHTHTHTHTQLFCKQPLTWIEAIWCDFSASVGESLFYAQCLMRNAQFNVQFTMHNAQWMGVVVAELVEATSLRKRSFRQAQRPPSSDRREESVYNNEQFNF